MMKLFLGITFLAPVLSMADVQIKGCPNYANENPSVVRAAIDTPKGLGLSRFDGVRVIDNYKGPIVDGLEIGKKTFAIEVEVLEPNAGARDKDGNVTFHYTVLTQNESLAKIIDETREDRRNYACTRGSELIVTNELNEIFGDTGEENENFAYRVVTGADELRCKGANNVLVHGPVTYTGWDGPIIDLSSIKLPLRDDMHPKAVCIYR